ncbi:MULTISPECIES: acyl-CoA dehydrogenase family protein [unclassified Pseudofrankia]|uniref:acyl-CoA dehydrogenase family protein n=1 Tax=unclassified Pseudofrankia TaxID=2994372 RepID=UPI0008D9F148|nr:MULTISPECIES: acyl-CoA dehydrogenase family protein [unclassified Pseudofrankia]MDT3441978.1 acyl-CoA dehydrogenase family protein [Pseudofrankia sp. BMG5.37]OHV44603.1 acyl-CoA dehydrogenase [Pseudofrankia sp. BMG5.36]
MPSDTDSFVEEARAFLDTHATRRTGGGQAVQWGVGDDQVAYFSADPPDVDAARVAEAKAWQKVRHDNGFGWITGPAEFGGRGLTSVHDLAYDALEAEYDVPDTSVLSLIGLGMIGPTILTHAQEHIRRRYLPAMYAGDIIACQLFSEPGAGSDLASVRTSAVRDGDEWVLSGQKVWTSVAQHAAVGLALCRTDPDKPKHRGITAFLVDMAAPGVEIRPLRQMSGGADFNEVFLTDVRVPDDHRLGDVDGGWAVALTTLMNERASVGGEGAAGPAGRAVSLPFLAELLRANGRLDDAAARRELAGLYAEVAATDYLNHQSLRRARAGEQPGPEASVSKLMYARNLTRGAHFAAEVVGPRLVADTGEWGTFAWAELLLATPALRILGGTEEIMKNILAERVLGLPKEPGIDTKSPFRELRRSGRGES